MLQQFLHHINSKKLCTHNDRILLAVSGGIDSMVMLDLFLKGGFLVGVAHCNFRLRGPEADAEEEFVRNYCAEKNIPLHIRQFDTKRFAKENKISIQVAARDLRYNFFSELLNEGYNVMATAHHLNDSMETVLLNLIRATGLDGLTGIASRNGAIIRPLLFATRKEIENYARMENILWKEDSSNRSDDYSRNLLRIKIIPLLREINPGLDTTFQSTLSRLKGTKELMDSMIAEVRLKNTQQIGNRILVHKDAILSSASPDVLLWEIIKEYGFQYDQCVKIIQASQTGKWFESPSHKLLVDRDNFILEEYSATLNNSAVINEHDFSASLNGESLSLEERKASDYALQYDNKVAQLDADKITFPLVWRYWKEGDTFCPFGMKGHKKVSDFLINHKIDRLDKQRVTVIDSGGEILWVVGYRISDRFRIGPETKRVLLVQWSEAK